MSKKKSLGSSPVSYKSQNSTMSFIPDRGVSKKKKEQTSTLDSDSQKNKENSKNKDSSTSGKKKVVSYYLKTDLIHKVKSIAQQNDMYYSALVTDALENWISENG